MSMKDVRPSNLGPNPAAQAFAAGQFDAAVTYEPYMSGALKSVSDGRILISSKETPGVIIDTLAFQPDFIQKNPQAVKGVVAAWFEALDLIKKDPTESYKIMGADVKQSGEDFAKSAALVTWSGWASSRGATSDEHLERLKARVAAEYAAFRKAAEEWNKVREEWVADRKQRLLQRWEETSFRLRLKQIEQGMRMQRRRLRAMSKAYA